MAASESVPVGVIVERRRIDNPWQDHVWRPVEVVAGAHGLGDWRLLREGDGWARFFAGTLDLVLYEMETEGYRTNLSAQSPLVYVVLRVNEAEPARPVTPVLVTACPYEAGKYTIGGDEIVDGVPMPPEIAAWVDGFVARFHAERTFVKRKNKPYDPRKGGFRRDGADR